jgi:hypothetical protein
MKWILLVALVALWLASFGMVSVEIAAEEDHDLVFLTIPGWSPLVVQCVISMAEV